MKNNKVRVCYILCYRDPNYTRTASLLTALSDIKEIDLVIVKNTHRSIVRYLETLFKLMRHRLNRKADVYIVGFRGHEIFWALYPLMRKSRIVFDEFINMHDWLVDEHKKLKPGSLGLRLIDAYMSWVVKKSDHILTDTDSHKHLAKELYKIDINKITAIPVGADEQIFKPLAEKITSKNFEVFFYGNMLPLHGVEFILKAIEIVSQDKKIIDKMHFTIVGGKNSPKMTRKIEELIQSKQLEKALTHIAWVNYEELPRYISRSALCLGGPFGGTGQAGRVITGKTYQFIAMGKPTIIGINADSSKYFKDKKNALLVNQTDAAAIAEAVLWSYKNQDKLPAIGIHAEALYREKFSVRVIEKKLRGVIFAS